MTTSTQQKMPAQLGAYPKISDRDALAGTLAGLTAVSVCGTFTREEQTRLQALHSLALCRCPGGQAGAARC